MTSLALSIAILSALIWLYLLVARGSFFYLLAYDDDLAAHPPLPEWPSVVAIVPARNEAETIAQSIRSLLDQSYSGKFSVVVVDDHSEDSTAAIVREVATQRNVTDRVRILNAPALPEGWTGKLWALNKGVTTLKLAPEPITRDSSNQMSSRAQQGMRFSDPPSNHANSPDYLWFTDADIIHAPDTLARLVSRAEQDHLDLTSLMVLLRAKSFAERATIPAFLFFFLKLYPPKWIANAKSRTAGAAGGCILLRTKALDRIGGLKSIRHEVIDDCSLARAVKQTSGKIWMGLTRQSVSLRRYNSFAEIRDMIARTAFTQLHYSALLLVGTLIGLAATYLAPIGLLFAHDNATRALAVATSLIMSLIFLPTIRYYRLNPLWAALLPATAAFYACATLLSAFRYYLNRGAQWKGRSQTPRASTDD